MSSSGEQLTYRKIVNHARSWNTQVLRWGNTKGRETWMLTLIYAFGSLLHLIMSTIRTQLRKTFMNVQLSQQCGQPLRDTMPQYLLMGRLVPERLTLWRASSIQLATHREVQSLDPWKRFSASFRCRALKTPLSWLELPTFKSITK